MDKPTSRDYHPSIMASDRIQRNIERLLDEVDNAIARRDWISVRDHAQDVLALDPQNSEASAFLAAATRALSSSDSSETANAIPSVSVPPLISDEQPTSFANG